MNLYTRIHPWGTAAGSATEYAAATRREVLEWLVGACPECGGRGGYFRDDDDSTTAQPCDACVGTGLDLTELVEVGAAEILRWGIKPEKLPAGERHLASLFVAELLRVLGRET